MKRKIIIPALLLCSGLLVNSAFAGKHPSPAELLAQAKVTEAQAREIALAKVPKGTVQSAELEVEHKVLIWSLDLATPGSKDVTEVAIDAKTGAIVSVDTESPEAQKKEIEQDKQEAKKAKTDKKAKKEKDDDDDDEKDEKDEKK